MNDVRVGDLRQWNFLGRPGLFVVIALVIDRSLGLQQARVANFRNDGRIEIYDINVMLVQDHSSLLSRAE